jgi:hypothetical protein
MSARSWAPEVKVDGTWSRNGLRFAAREDAERWARGLLMRWFAPTDSRATEADEEANVNPDGSTLGDSSSSSSESSS